jgi:hypothetical protein
VHDPVAAGEQHGQLVERRRVDPGAGVSGGELTGERHRPVDVEVDDGEVLDAETEQRVSDRGAGATGAQQHDVRRLRSGKSLREPDGEAGRIGVVSDDAVGLEHHGVDRAERSCRVVDVVEVGDHQLLTGVGDVQCVEPESARPLQDLADLLRHQPRGGQVDRAVHVVEPVGAALGHVQRRGEGRADALPDQTHQIWLTIHTDP